MASHAIGAAGGMSLVPNNGLPLVPNATFANPMFRPSMEAYERFSINTGGVPVVRREVSDRTTTIITVKKFDIK
jgi:hypothetical protein